MDILIDYLSPLIREKKVVIGIFSAVEIENQTAVAKDIISDNYVIDGGAVTVKKLGVAMMIKRIVINVDIVQQARCIAASQKNSWSAAGIPAGGVSISIRCGPPTRSSQGIYRAYV